MGNSEIIRDGASMRPSVHGPRHRAISQEGTQCPALHHSSSSSVTLDATLVGASGCPSSRALECAQNTYVSLQLGRITQHSLFHNEVLNISCNLLNIELDVKDRMVVSVSVVYSCDRVADWELWFPTTAHRHVRVSYCLLLARKKIKIQNLKYSF